MKGVPTNTIKQNRAPPREPTTKKLVWSRPPPRARATGPPPQLAVRPAVNWLERDPMQKAERAMKRAALATTKSVQEEIRVHAVPHAHMRIKDWHPVRPHHTHCAPRT